MRSLNLIFLLCLLAVSHCIPTQRIPNPSLGSWNPDMGPFGAINDSEPSSIRVKRQWGWGRRGGWGGGRGYYGGGWGRGGGGWGRRGGWGGRRYGGWGWGK